MSSDAAIFQGVESVVIQNGRFVIDNRRTASDIQSLPPGIRTLINSNHISWTSRYNSVTRMNEANDLAVRDAVVGWGSLFEYKTTSELDFDADDAVNAIFSWATEGSTAEPLIMWVHDDDRTKTSFIAQVVAYLLASRRLLSASYFFDVHTDRNSLVPTLVHEFTMQHKRDDLVIEISKAIESNPVGVFSLHHREQFDRLLVLPLSIVSEWYEPDPQIKQQYDIILLHAIEDCNNEGGFHESFLAALLDTLISIKNSKYPQRLLIIGKRTDRLEEFLMGRLASRSPILQRPIQSQQWLRRDQDIRQKTIELERVEKELHQSLLAIHDKEEKMVQKDLRREEECKKIKTLLAKTEQEVAERILSVQGRENRVREREELAEQMLRDIRKDRLRIEQQEKAPQTRTRDEEVSRARYPPATGLGNTRLPPRTPTSPITPGLQLLFVGSPIQEQGTKEDARMISPASQVTKNDRIIILMGPLLPQKHDFIDCLTNCVNPWRLHPSTKTSNQFFDSHILGNGRFWVKAVRTQRQSHTILFVDFPSLGNDDLAAAKILENIGTWLKEIRENDVAKVAGILYFHPFSESEWGPSHYNLRALGQICGDQAARKVIFVFEEPSHPTAQKAEAFFSQHYGNLMRGLGASIATFDNTAATGWRIVDRLLGPQSGDVSLFLQDELFVLKRSLHETYVGRQLYGDLIGRLRRQLEVLGTLPRRSDSTGNQYAMIQAELERLQQLLRRSRPSRAQEAELPARAVNFPEIIGFEA